jgi:hypothetical protein
VALKTVPIEAVLLGSSALASEEFEFGGDCGTIVGPEKTTGPCPCAHTEIATTKNSSAGTNLRACMGLGLRMGLI